jgi:Spy/CpxP family protein refolding chaperone
MRRGWSIVLLLSLGINLGLGLHLLRRADGPSAPAPPFETGPPMPVDRAQVERFLGRRLDRMQDRLDLSPQQRTALWDLHLADGREIFERRRRLQEARTAFQQLFGDEEPELMEVLAAQRRLSGLQAELDSVVARIMFRERELLTPRQRQAYRGFFPGTRDGQRGATHHPGRRRGGRPPEG